MKKRTIIRALCAVLAVLLACSLVGCAGKSLHATPKASKTVATAGNVDIRYDELYYLAKNRQAELQGTSLDAEALRAELEQFVWDNLLTRSHALISVADDYGISCDKDKVGENVQAQIEDLIADETIFAGDRDAYIASLDEAFMTEAYLRTYIATENYLATEVVLKMIERGELDDSDEAALAVIANRNEFIRTVHVYIAKNNGVYSEPRNRLNAENIATRLAAIVDGGERYAEMRNAIKNYDNDQKDTTGDGFYFARGEMQKVYEDAAFSLVNDFDASGVVETDDGFYVIMRMPLDEAYVNRNLEVLKSSIYFSKLNAMVDARYAELQRDFALTSFGEALDLTTLPEIRAAGGETLRTVLIGLSIVVGAGAVIAMGVVVWKKKRPAAKKKTK